MNRRELVKAAGAILISNKMVEAAFDFRPSGGGYVVFFNPTVMGADFPERAEGFPPNTVFHAVDVSRGQSLDDAVRIYRS